MKKIAIIGSGISGLGCAYALKDRCQLTIFESSQTLGGHANTVDVRLDGQSYGVDTGFLVYNERTYPGLIRLFEELRVKVAPSEMSFSVSRRDVDREWCGSSLASLFAQPSNALSPRFWSMLKDIVRFNKHATRLAISEQAGTSYSGIGAPMSEPVGAYLARHGYGSAFSEDYLLPMAAAIWSCPIATMAAFPIGSFVRFFHNHGLLQVSNRPQWFTCEGGSKNYVQALAEVLTRGGHDVRVNTPILQVSRANGQVELRTQSRSERFDGVVMACHSDQSLKLLSEPTILEKQILSAIAYQENTAYLHSDRTLMPKRRKAWAAWNYLCDQSPGKSAEAQVSVTYWLNRLQPLPFKTDLFVSLNPIEQPREDSVLQKIFYAHPVFDMKASLAQREISKLQGQQNTWYAGAWCGYGFHEDGLQSGLAVARHLQATLASQGVSPMLHSLAA